MLAPTRSVMTLAMRNPAYFRMAVNLARSFLLWNGGSDIRFWLVTDQESALPPDLEGISVLRVGPDELPDGFSAKLHLDRLLPSRQTLFLDADCLCTGPLQPLFERLSGRPVAVIGWPISEGEWFGDVRSLLQRFGLAEMPRFNGGLYYLEQGDQAASVWQKAREIEVDYDTMGLIRLRGRPNEELLMAVAMALHGVEAFPDDGTIMGDPDMSSDVEVSVLRGRARLVNPPAPDPRHRALYPFHVVHPVIVHFVGDYPAQWRYLAEEKKLSLVMGRGWSPKLAEFIVNSTFGWRGRLGDMTRTLLRPWYHRMFGVRPVRPSDPRFSKV